MRKTILLFIAVLASTAFGEVTYNTDGAFGLLLQDDYIGVGLDTKMNVMLTVGVKRTHSLSVLYITDGSWGLLYQRNGIAGTGLSVGLGITSQRDGIFTLEYRF